MLRPFADLPLPPSPHPTCGPHGGTLKMEPDSTQPSLLARLRDSTDAAAWRRFDARYGELIIGYCRSRGLQLSDAEDVRQLVMFNLAKVLPSFEYRRDRGRFRAYLGIVVRNAIARHVSRHTTREAVLGTGVLEELAGGREAPDAAWEEQWVRHHCRAALNTLRRTYDARSVDFFDRLLAGEPIGALAKEFGMTPENARKVKQRVKDRLKTMVVEQIRDEDHDARPQ